MTEDFTIYMSDIRAAKMCSKGTRDFFCKHNLDWSDFLKNGVPASSLLNTNDHMARRVVEVARGRKQ